MTQEEIATTTLIAEFVGYNYGGRDRKGLFFGRKVDYWTHPRYKGYRFFIEFFKFHTSWDWLMPVVEKITHDDECYCERFDIGIAEVIVRGYREQDDQLQITIPFHHKRYFHNLNLTTTKIQATYQAVVQFIQWYNEQQL